METIQNILTGVLALFGAFFLFVLFALLLTIGIGFYVWYRIKKQFQEMMNNEFQTSQNTLDETIIDVEEIKKDKL